MPPVNYRQPSKRKHPVEIATFLIILLTSIAILIYVQKASTVSVGMISRLTTSHKMSPLVDKKVEAIGVISCIPSYEGPNDVSLMKVKAIIKFDDGTSAVFSEGEAVCEYAGEEVAVRVRVYKCKKIDQCGGFVLKNVESVNLR
jgi:hypothetical protein